MADHCAVYTVAGLTLNAAAPANTYVIDEEGSIDGLDGLPIRRTVEPAPQTTGALVFPAFGKERIVTFEGALLVRSVDVTTDPAGFQAAINALEAAMVAQLDAFINSDTTLAWPSHSLTVRRGEQPALFRGRLPHKRFLFSLIAHNPVIS